MSIADDLTIDHSGKSWSYDLSGHPKRSVILIECAGKGWWVPDFLPDFSPDTDRATIKPDGTLEILRLTGERVEARPIGQTLP